MKCYDGESFLNRLYKDLHLSELVMHTACPRDSVNDKISKYLERLGKSENLAKKSETGIQLLKEMYYRKYIIKPESVPESYFELQKRIALERGYGHIEVNDQMRNRMIDSIIVEQKKSLDMWLDYLSSDDVIYPEWFKYYVFQSVVKLGSYDKEKYLFNKRSCTTTSPFAELNREALSSIYDYLCLSFKGNKVDDSELQTLLENGSFSKLYSYMLRKFDEVTRDVSGTDGIWIKYIKGSEPDDLVKSLEGRGTGWCTAGIETARSQLELGDFHVYYTKDSLGEYKIPRIAIRMIDESIEEIRGINPSQNLEPEMQEILEEKLKEFPDRDLYMQKVNDMKLLTHIYNEYQIRDLTKEELCFLYEINDSIKNFGYDADPRANEIIRSRNVVADYNFLFDGIDTYEGNLNLRYIRNACGLVLPRRIVGNLSLYVNSLDGVILPEMIDGYLEMPFIDIVENVKITGVFKGYFKEKITISGNGNYPKSVNALFFRSLHKLKNVDFSEYSIKDLHLPNVSEIEGDIDLSNTNINNVYLDHLIKANNIIFPKHLKGDIHLSYLKEFDSLILPEYMEGDLHLNSLTNLENVELPKVVKGWIYLTGLDSLENITLPANFKGINLNRVKIASNVIFPDNCGSINLFNLVKLSNVKFPEICNGELDLTSLPSLDGVILPNLMMDSLFLNSVSSIMNYKLPSVIKGNLNLGSLNTFKNITLPETVGGDLILSSISSANNLSLPSEVGGNLDLKSLTSTMFLNFPSKVGGLDLSSLKSNRHLNLPSVINGNLTLKGIETIDTLDLSRCIIKGSVDLSNLVEVRRLCFPPTVKSIFLVHLEKFQTLLLPLKLEGKLDLRNLSEFDNLVLPKSVGGDLLLNSVKDLRNVEMPDYVNGTFSLNKVTEIGGVVFPSYVKYLNLENVKKAISVVLPSSIGTMIMSNLVYADNVTMPNSAIDINMDRLKSVDGLIFAADIDYDSFYSEHVSLDEIMKINNNSETNKF